MLETSYKLLCKKDISCYVKRSEYILANDVIEKIISDLEQSELDIMLYFVKKGNKKYVSYRPNVSISIKNDIIKLIINYLIKKTKCSFVPYDPTRSPNIGEIAICNIDYVGNFNEVLESLNISDEADTSLKPNEITFYCLTISDRNETFNYKIFRRVNRLRKLSTNGILGFFEGNKFCKLEAETFGIDGDVDLITDGKQIYIFYNASLERVFRLKEQFRTKATEALDIIEKTKGIANFEEFRDDCLSDARIHKSLCKILGTIPDLDRAFENFNNIKIAIGIFDEDIAIDEEKSQLIYTDKTQLRPILNIIKDAYCYSYIRNRNVINKD